MNTPTSVVPPDARARANAAGELQALAALIRRPPLDDVQLNQDVALRIAVAIDVVTTTPPVNNTAVPAGFPLMSLAECPIGLFWAGDTLGFKSEYGNNDGSIDAFIVSSGEFFWGPPPQTIPRQRAMLVCPIAGDRAEAALSSRASKVVTAVNWREGWYGSEPQRGSSIVDERGNLIVYLGGNEETHRLTTKIVAAHNRAFAAAAGSVLEAAELLDRYAAFIRDEVKADDLERHPYLPAIEQAASDLRALRLPDGPSASEPDRLLEALIRIAAFKSKPLRGSEGERSATLGWNRAGEWAARVAAAAINPKK